MAASCHLPQIKKFISENEGVRLEEASEVEARGQTDSASTGKTELAWGCKVGGLRGGAQTHQGQVQTMIQGRNNHVNHRRDGSSRGHSCSGEGWVPPCLTEGECRQEEQGVYTWLFRVRIMALEKQSGQHLPVSRLNWDRTFAHEVSPMGTPGLQQTLCLRGSTTEIRMHLHFPQGPC